MNGSDMFSHILSMSVLLIIIWIVLWAVVGYENLDRRLAALEKQQHDRDKTE